MVVDGVINNSAGWRAKVLSLAQRQAANSRAATANAASMWRHRAARLGRKGEGSGSSRCATAAVEGADGSKPGSALPALPASSAPSARQLGREESNMLAGAVSAETTPRAGLAGTDIVVDDSPREQGGQDDNNAMSRTDNESPAQHAQHAAVQLARQAAAAAPQRQMSPIVQQLVSRLRSNAAAAADAGATGSERQALAALRTVSGSMSRSRPESAGHGAALSPLSRAASGAVAAMPAAKPSADGGKLSQRWLSRTGPSGLALQSCLSRPAVQERPQERPTCTPGMSAFDGGSASEAAADTEAGQPLLPEAADATPAGHASLGESDAESADAANTALNTTDGRPDAAARFDWRSTAARMHQVAAASRAAAAEPEAPGPARQGVASAPAGGTTTPRPSGLGAGSRLLVPTASSRARTAPAEPPASVHGASRSVPTAARRSDAECSRRRHHTQQMRQQAGRPVAQAQRRRLAALALVRRGVGCPE